MAGSWSSPCAACKLLRRRCAKDCIFSPYFPPDQPRKFSIVHKVFGASNVNKMLQELPVHHRADAVSSLVYEANARMKDPVYGCVGTISYLHNQVSQLQMQLAVAQAEILCLKMQQESSSASSSLLSNRHDAQENKAFVFQHSSFDSPREFINYSSSRNHVAQEPLKRESPWP
ncbi:LOB domain-containing protein 12-like [Curcuma longa]|uniref:LOB domain-containing protein 12-like n=1 Tax=Curcuma longa TaxID=136217 RepID=UPI003D9EB7D4